MLGEKNKVWLVWMIFEKWRGILSKIKKTRTGCPDLERAFARSEAAMTVARKRPSLVPPRSSAPRGAGPAVAALGELLAARGRAARVSRRLLLLVLRLLPELGGVPRIFVHVQHSPAAACPLRFGDKSKSLLYRFGKYSLRLCK